MPRFLAFLGRSLRLVLASLGGPALFYRDIFARLLRPGGMHPRVFCQITLRQIRFSGLEAAPLVAVIAALVGAVSIIQSTHLLSGLAEDLSGTLLVSVIIRELGPLIAAVILIGRSGTAMATEIGSMRLNREVDILEAHRIDPIAYIVLPRICAAVCSLFCLIAVFDLMGILGGFGISALRQDLSFALLLHRVLEALDNTDLLVTALKALLFGQAIAVLACFFGLRVRSSSTELPRAVTRAMVLSFISVFALDILLAALFYL